MKVLVLLLMAALTTGEQRDKSLSSYGYQGYQTRSHDHHAHSHKYHSYKPRYHTHTVYYSLTRQSTHTKGFANPVTHGRRKREADTNRNVYSQPKLQSDYKFPVQHQGRGSVHHQGHARRNQYPAKYPSFYLQ